jgi:uncharacterized phage protein (TIGR01671 family)
MREIKFRAWHKEAGIMASKPYPINIGRFGFFSEDNQAIVIALEPNVILLQFTGLKDKNGKEIYEGDVVKCLNGSQGVFVWSNKLGMWRIDTTQTIGGWSHPTEGFDGDTLEVIGNIYENPELLKA